MDTCIIKNCTNEAYEDGLCAQHYIEILKKVVSEKKLGKKISKSSEGPGEDISIKSQFMMHSLLLHVDKFTDSVVSSFSNIFNLTKDESVDIYRHMGGKYLKKQNHQKAIPLLKKVIELNPDDAESKYQLGSIYFAREDYDKANACFDEAILLDPDNADYHFALGLVCEQKKLIDEAVTSHQKAAELNPENPEVFYRLGMIFDNQEKYKEAVELFQKAIDLNPNNTDYYQSLGFTYESMDLHKDAVNCHKKVFSLKKPSL